MKEAEPSPQAIERMRQELAEWLEAERLPNAVSSDEALLQFVYGCKFRLDRAKFKLKRYLNMRRQDREWFGDRDPQLPHIAELLDLGVFLPLLDRDDQGRYIMLVRATINNARVNPMSDVFKVGMMIVDLAMEEDLAIAHKGVVVIVDLAGVGLQHSLQMTPGLIRRAVHSWQDCYPVPIKSIHFVNCPIYVNVVLNLFKTFMREKLRRRVQVHGRNLGSLRRIVGAELLPREYGGMAGPIGPTVNHWADKVRRRRDWFLNDVTTTSA